jgi:hypothetical protein
LNFGIWLIFQYYFRPSATELIGKLEVIIFEETVHEVDGVVAGRRGGHFHPSDKRLRWTAFVQPGVAGWGDEDG